MAFDAPLSDAQDGLWYAQRMDPQNPIYNTGQYVEIDGPLNAEALAEAVRIAMAESTALTISIVEREDGLRQVEGDPVTLHQVDCRGRPAPEMEAQDRITRDMNTPVDPTRDPLAVQRLFHLGSDRYIWYTRVHHLVIDGYGTALLNKRICDLYASRVEDAPPRTSAFAPYSEVLAAEAEYRESDQWERDRRFWHSEFGDKPAVASLSRGVALTAKTFHRSVVRFPESLPSALRELSEAARVSWPDSLLGLVAAFLERHTGTSEIIPGVPTMNRMGTPSARVPAMVMNVLPARITIEEDTPLQQWLPALARKLRHARRHGKYRSEQLRRDLGLLGGLRRLHGPLINILPFESPPRLPGCRTRLRVLSTGAVDDLTFTFRAGAAGGGLTLELDSNPILYGEQETAEIAARLQAFLERSLASTRLADVPTLTPDEHRTWVFDVNATEREVEATTLTELIERSMRQHSRAPALSFEGSTMSYGELDRETASLAAYLAEAGVLPGDIVAVSAPRSMELVIALVATLRAGAAYLPIDPDYPRRRIAAMLQSAKPRVSLTTSACRERLPATAPLLALDQRRPFKAPLKRPGISGSDAAYVIYTSGSTGEPKGVVNEHRGIVNRLQWMRAYFSIRAEDRILQKTPATFDVSVWEFFLPLIAGATLEVAPPDAHKDPARLASLIREAGITTIHFVPSMLAVFLAEPAAQGLHVKRVICSGEELSASLRDRFHETLKADLFNLYGPTEAAIDVSSWDASSSDASAPVPIGFPIWNTSLHVLDRRMRPVPPEASGQLYIGGVQVARGYLGRPDLTGERFVPDPFREGDARLYRTGDAAYRRRDGALVFLGRSDAQVKIRGQRVELGEIENAILDSGRVSQVAVVLREDRPGDQRLAAYLISSEEGRRPDPEAIRTFLASRLPDFMIPAAFMELERLPLTHNGKLDLSALPRPNAPVSSGRPPLSDSEKHLAELFSQVLGLEEIGVEDDFFDLGGHSLLAARLMAQVREHWGADHGLGVLFANPSVARMARLLEAGHTQDNASGLDLLIPLSATEEAKHPGLFCIHPAGGIAWCYAGLARALGAACLVYGVQARGLKPEPLPSTLEAMAAGYVDEILRVQPDGPYHLLGWSVGGIIAHVMAVRFQSLGVPVGVLALLDAYPSDCWREEPEPDESTALKALLHIAGQDPDSVDVALTREAVASFLRHVGHPLGELSDETLSGVLRVVENNSRLVREHHHQRFRGDLIHFRATLEHVGNDLSPQQWSPYVDGRIAVHDQPFRHAHLTGPEAVRRIAAVLKPAFKESEIMNP